MNLYTGSAGQTLPANFLKRNKSRPSRDTPPNTWTIKSSPALMIAGLNLHLEMLLTEDEMCHLSTRT